MIDYEYIYSRLMRLVLAWNRLARLQGLDLLTESAWKETSIVGNADASKAQSLCHIEGVLIFGGLAYLRSRRKP